MANNPDIERMKEEIRNIALKAIADGQDRLTVQQAVDEVGQGLITITYAEAVRQSDEAESS